MDRFVDVLMERVMPVFLCLFLFAMLIFFGIGAVAILTSPTTVKVDEIYQFNTKVVEGHNILIVTRSHQSQFEIVDLGPAPAEAK